MKSIYSFGILLPCIFLFACGPLAEEKDDANPSENRVNIDDGEQARWDRRNDPNYFMNDFVYDFSALPIRGEVSKIPWAGSYWPTYRDSINYKWNGSHTVSAPKKYQIAFNSSLNIENLVSHARGVDRNWNVRSCTQDSQCSGGTCAKREGSSSGKCIPKWFGICNSWSLAAIHEPEPKRSVTYNGVEFHVNDIKALVTYSYLAGVKKTFLASRCYSSDENLGVNADGNLISPACADINAGSFHVVAANLLGLRKQSFVEDRTATAQVWNQPVRRFEVTYNQPVTAAEANAILGFGSSSLLDSAEGSLSQKQWQAIGTYQPKVGSSLQVVMTGTGDADLYVKLNSKPSYSNYDCRPYLSGSNEKCTVAIPAGTENVQVYVAGYAVNSTYNVKVYTNESTSDVYRANPEARAFRHIKTSLYYIKESSANTDGNLAATINSYTGRDRYEYILELDSAGKIIGGEWVGDSKLKHPDFLWYGQPKQNTTISGINWLNVKKILNESVK